MNARAVPVVLFCLGRIVATVNARDSLTQKDILEGIRRHQAGDWGSLSEPDWAANDRGLVVGGRLVSRYYGANGTKFWIITEADRDFTTILLPEDY